MMLNKIERFLIGFIAFMLVVVLGAQCVLAWKMSLNLPQTVEFEDTRLMQEGGWDAAQNKTAESDIGLRTQPLTKAFLKDGQQIEFPICRIDMDFANSHKLQYIQGGLWEEGSSSPSLIIPEEVADSLNVNVGDSLNIEDAEYLITGIYCPYQLVGTENSSTPIYTNWLSVEDESTMETLLITIPLEDGTLESTKISSIFDSLQLAPYGRSCNLRNWSQLVFQVFPLELFVTLLVPAVWLTVQGGSLLCGLILSSENRVECQNKRNRTIKALILSLIPAALMAFILSQVRVPGEFLPASNIFDFERYGQIMQGMMAFVEGNYGFSAAAEQYLLTLRYMVYLAIPVIAFGWSMSFLILKKKFFQNECTFNS